MEYEKILDTVKIVYTMITLELVSNMSISWLFLESTSMCYTEKEHKPEKWEK